VKRGKNIGTGVLFILKSWRIFFFYFLVWSLVFFDAPFDHLLTPLTTPLLYISL